MKRLVAIVGALLIMTGLKAQKTVVRKETEKPGVKVDSVKKAIVPVSKASAKQELKYSGNPIKNAGKIAPAAKISPAAKIAPAKQQ